MPTSSIARRVRPHSSALSTPSSSKQLDLLRYANDLAAAESESAAGSRSSSRSRAEAPAQSW